jgi:hypothetical protein
MWNRVIEAFFPLTTIAKELTAIRELYELDLGSRRPPVYRVTETPGKSDTSVTYTDDEVKSRNALHKVMATVMGQIEDDDEYDIEVDDEE